MDGVDRVADKIAEHVRYIHEQEQCDHRILERLTRQANTAFEQDVVEDMEAVQRRKRQEIEQAGAEITQRELEKETRQMQQPGRFDDFGKQFPVVGQKRPEAVILKGKEEAVAVIGGVIVRNQRTGDDYGQKG